MSSKVSFIHTLGGNTLDNLSAVPSSNPAPYKSCIHGHLETLVGNAYTVVTHAYRGRTISTLLSIHVLNRVQREITNHPDTSHYVIISAGSNECGQVFEGRRWLEDIQRISQSYLHIVDAVKDMGRTNIGGPARPILVLEPLPHVSDAARAKLTRAGRIVVALHVLFGAVVPITVMCIAIKVSVVFAAMYATVVLLTTFITVSRCSSARYSLLFITKEACKGRDLATLMLQFFMRRFYQPLLSTAHREGFAVCDLTNFAPLHDERASVDEGERIASVLSRAIQECHNDNQNFIYRYQTDASSNILMSRMDPHEWEIGRDTPYNTALIV